MGRAILITFLLLVAMVFVSSVAAGVAGENSSFLVSMLFVLCSAIWAASDASKIEIKKYKTSLSGPVAIFFGTLILWIIVFPWYLVVRQRVLAGEVPLKIPGTAPQVPQASPAVAISADEIKKLKELLDLGAITQEEFDLKKQQFLAVPQAQTPVHAPAPSATSKPPSKSISTAGGVLIILVAIGLISYLISSLSGSTTSSKESGSAVPGISVRDIMPAATPDESAKPWQLLKTFKGSGMKKTETFDVPSNEWKIEWSFKDSSGFGAGTLSIIVYTASGEMKDLVANTMGASGEDSSIIRGRGSYYLDFNAANARYEVKVYVK